MKKSNILDTIYFLREKAEQNKLVIFVGAGVSRNVPDMLSWSELVTEMAKSIGYTKCDICIHRKECKEKCEKCAEKENCVNKCLTAHDFSPDDYLKIPQYVFNENSKNYNEVLRRCVSDKSIPDAPLSDAIFEINPAHIITTNYDKLLEASANEFRRQYEVVVVDRDLLEASKSKYIIKMHGDILQPDTIVLKEQDYLEYSQKHVLIELFIKALLADHTILFLGYSLNDYNVKLIISWINYLRSQNKAIDRYRKIGYIVLDEEALGRETEQYFRKNNIGVLNIHELSLVENIPPLLSHIKGKRLYSFLRIIKDPSLEGGMFSKMSMNKAVEFAQSHRLCDYSLLLKLLNVSNYVKRDSTLCVYDDSQYSRLISYLEKGDNKEILYRLLLNCGISTIYSYNNREMCYSIDLSDNDQLIADPFYSAYLKNDYAKLLVLCDAEKRDFIKSAFYRQFATGYLGIEDLHSKVVFDNLSEDDKISFLHNQAFIEAINGYRFNSEKPSQYINNIASTRERAVYQPYLDLFEGNTSKRIEMLDTLAKLKENIQKSTTSFFSNGAIGELFKIKNLAYIQYYFYFMNHLLMQGFNDLPKFLRPYIEAMICANSDLLERESNASGFNVQYEKYEITQLDFDIISKFISIKDLYSVIKTEKISGFKTSPENVVHLVSCFINLANSIVISKTFGHHSSSLITLANLAQLLELLEVCEKEKMLLGDTLGKLFSNKDFNLLFWNTSCPDYRICTKVFSSLTDQLPRRKNVSCIKSIVKSPEFFSYLVNTEFDAARNILGFFIGDDSAEEVKTTIYSLIDQEENFNKKVLLIRCFYKTLPEDNKVKEYKGYLSKHFSELNVQAMYDLIFNNWITLSQEGSESLISTVLKLYRERRDDVRMYPDPLETKLECIYILHITGKLEDISALEEMCVDYPHLRFLLHPDTFDYKQIDFSNYMWANFARRKEYEDFFVAHKEHLIPLVQDHLRKGEATETEKKLLYGVLLDKNELWKKY